MSLVATAPGAVSDRLAVGLVRRRLTSEMVGQHIYLFGHLASTADILRRLATAGAREGTVVIAEDALALHVSVLLCPVEPLLALPALAAVVGRALAEALREAAPNRAPRAECSVIADRDGCWAVVSVVVHLGAASGDAPQDMDRNAFVAGILNAVERLYAVYTRGGQSAVLAC